MSNKKTLLAAGMALAAMLALPHTASAVAFTGQIDYTGAHLSDNADLTVATQSQILATIVVVNTGSFSTIPFLGSLNHTSPVVWAPPGTPYEPLWSHDDSGIAFNLNTLTIVSEAPDQIGLRGTGTFFCFNANCSYDATPGIWNMTFNNAGLALGSFSSSSTASAPEPGSLALLGLGLMGLGLSRRRKA